MKRYNQLNNYNKTKHNKAKQAQSNKYKFCK